MTGATKLTIDSALGEVAGQSQLTISPSQTATYTLRASNSKGEVTKDVTVTVNNPSDPCAPNNPKALVASPGNPGIISLNWTGSTGSTMYVIERKSASDFKQIKALTVNSYADGGLYPGVEYTYRVRAINGSGARSGWSNYAKAIAPGTAPVITRIELTPSNPTTMQPNQTVQLNAMAYAGSNELDLSQDIFTWHSSSILNATVDQDGLVASGNSNMISSDASMLSTFGLKSEAWRNSNSANSTFTGGAGTVMESFSFQYTGEYAYFSELIVKETNPATPAFAGSYASNDKAFVAAGQRTLPNDTKIFFAGFVLENVQANLRDDFIQKLMTM